MGFSATDESFTLDGCSWRWADVRAIATFKYDMFVYDEVILALQVRDFWIEVSEQERSFGPLAEELQYRYPTIPRDWLDRVMRPTFARNYRVLWSAA